MMWQIIAMEWVGYVLKNTLSENGYVSRGVCSMRDDRLERVVEHTKVFKVQGGAEFVKDGQRVSIDENSLVSMNFWGFTPSIFDELERGLEEFVKENKDNRTAEYFIPLVATSLLSRNKVSIEVLQSNDRWFGITYKDDKEIVVQSIKELIDEGVYPGVLWPVIGR